MTTGVLHIPLTAFRSFGAGLRVGAHNLANVLTPNFKAGSVSYAELPAQAGVTASVTQPAKASGSSLTPGPPISYAGSSLKPSNTDVAREMVDLIVTSRTYQANAKMSGTVDSMLGTVIDMAV